MPPKLPPLESSIGSRLRTFRESLLIPRTRLARQVEIGPQRLVAIEGGKGALRWGEFLAYHHLYQLSPYWLLDGSGPQRAGFDPTAFLPGLHANMPFSKVFKEYVKAFPLSASEDLSEEERSALGEYMGRAARLVSELKSLPVELRLEVCRSEGFSDGLEKIEETIADAKAGSAKVAAVLGRRIARAEKFFQKIEKKELRNPALEDSLSGVQSTHHNLNSLLAEIRKLASKGTQKDLACEIGTSPKRLSEWLTGKRIPDAHNTLLLLNFVSRKSTK